MTPKLLVVLGATGTQGGSVVESFLNDPDWRLRAVTRDPAKPSSAALASKGVEIVRGDLDDPASLRTAFASAHAIFAVTDYFANLGPAQRLQEQSGESKDQPPFNQLAGELELQQAKNVFDAAAKTEGLERLVWSSLPYVSKRSGGRYTRAYPFDTKGKADEYLFSTHPALGKKSSIIQVGWYVENHLNYSYFQPQKASDGSFAIRFPWPPNTRVDYILGSTQTGHFVKPLITSPTAGITLRAYSAQVPIAQFTELWGKTLGVNARYEEVTLEEYLRDISPPMDGQLADMSSYFRELGFLAKEGSVAPDEIGIRMPGVESFLAWIKSADWSSILGKQ